MQIWEEERRRESFESCKCEMEIPSSEEILECMSSCLSQIKWRLKPTSKRRLDIGFLLPLSLSIDSFEFIVCILSKLVDDLIDCLPCLVGLSFSLKSL